MKEGYFVNMDYVLEVIHIVSYDCETNLLNTSISHKKCSVPDEKKLKLEDSEVKQRPVSRAGENGADVRCCGSPNRCLI